MTSFLLLFIAVVLLSARLNLYLYDFIITTIIIRGSSVVADTIWGPSRSYGAFCGWAFA